MAKKQPTKQELEIAELKERYLEYYADLPVQKYAAMYVGRDEDTIKRWRENDTDFADKVNLARAKWVRRKASKAKVEFALERLEKSIWKEAKEVEVTLPTPILGGITQETKDGIRQNDSTE